MPTPHTPLAITTEALSLVNNLIIDAHAAGRVSDMKAFGNAYGAMMDSKEALCRYIAELERDIGRPQDAKVKF